MSLGFCWFDGIEGVVGVISVGSLRLIFSSLIIGRRYDLGGRVFR